MDCPCEDRSKRTTQRMWLMMDVLLISLIIGFLCYQIIPSMISVAIIVLIIMSSLNTFMIFMMRPPEVLNTKIHIMILMVLFTTFVVITYLSLLY
jgi:hypothetical protein